MKTMIEAMERSPIPSNFIGIQSTPESLRLSSRFAAQYLPKALSIPSHFPFRVRLAHCLLTRIDCVPEESWTYWRRSSVKNESSKKS
jgi:hypothetical protein